MDRKKFILYNVEPDGDCGYHAILNQFIKLGVDINDIFKLNSHPILISSSPITYDKNTIKQMRITSYNGVLKNPNLYINPTNAHGVKMSMESIKTNAYMHDSVILWISTESNVCINIYNPLGDKGYKWSEFKPNLNTEFVCTQSIYLQNTNGNHFDILIPISSVTPPKTKTSIKSKPNDTPLKSKPTYNPSKTKKTTIESKPNDTPPKTKKTTIESKPNDTQPKTKKTTIESKPNDTPPKTKKTSIKSKPTYNPSKTKKTTIESKPNDTPIKTKPMLTETTIHQSWLNRLNISPRSNSNDNNTNDENTFNIPSINKVFHTLIVSSKQTKWNDIKQLTDKYNTYKVKSIVDYNIPTEQLENEIFNEYNTLIKKKITLSSILRIAMIVSKIKKPNTVPKMIQQYIEKPQLLSKNVLYNDWITICKMVGIK